VPSKDDMVVMLTSLGLGLGIITFWMWIWKEIIFT
jgi:hypothetical protein